MLRAIVALLTATTLALWQSPPASAATITLSGTVHTPTPLRDGSVSLVLDTGEQVATGPIASDGTYSLNAPAGTYQIAVYGFTVESPSASGNTTYSFNWGFEATDFSADTHRDLDVPARPLTVDVVDGDGNPVSTEFIDIGCAWYVGNVYTTWSSTNRNHSVGTKTLYAAIDPGGDGIDCHVNATRSNSEPYNYHTVVVDMSPTEDNHVTITVPDLITIHGTVDASDPRMKGYNIYLQPKGDFDTMGNVEVPVAADGSYSVQVPPGPYKALYRYDNADHSIGAALWDENIDAPGSVTVNKHLTVRELTAHFVDPTGQPLTPEPSNTYLSCERPRTVDGAASNEWIATGGEGAGPQPTLFLPAVDDDDPVAFTCTLRLISDDPDNGYYGGAIVPPAGATEVTLIVPGFGLFAGPPEGGGGPDPDGVSNLTEAAGPNAGDGNYDGVPDYAQDNVTSLPASGGTTTDAPGWITLVGPAGTTMTGVSTMDTADAVGPPPRARPCRWA